MKKFPALFSLVLRVVLAAVFIWAGLAKLPDPSPLAASIARFDLVPGWMINPIALALPVFELLSGLGLLLGPWKKQAAFNLAVLCGLFLLVLASAWARGIEVECSCFGANSAASVGELILRDLLLFAIAVFVGRDGRQRVG